MEPDLENTLLSLLADPAAIAAQADIAQAAALARQELLLRQRAGAAAFQLRQAKTDGASADEIAELEARVSHRTSRLEAARMQAAAADVKRPFPDNRRAQVFGRATGTVEKPPLTAALLTDRGTVAAQGVAGENGVFHLAADGSLTGVRVQLSDAAGRVLWRSPAPVNIPAGTVLYVDAAVQAPAPEPGPVPTGLQMPDLLGQSEVVALVLLSRLGIAEPRIQREMTFGQPGIVLAQDPKAGTLLASKARVSLTISRLTDEKPPNIFLPGLVGRPLDEAEAALKALGLRAAIRRASSEGPPDMVLEQDPAEGTPLGDLRSVSLTLSQTPEEAPSTVVVPDLLGKPRDLALELLKATDLRFAVTETADPGAASGVIGQSPSAGALAGRRTVVAVTLNTPPEPDPGLVILPELVGRSGAEARKLLAALGLKTATSGKPDAAPKGEVLGQEPPAATRVAAGSAVTLTLSSGKDDAGPDLGSLIAAMAEDPRAAEAGLSADRLKGQFQTADIDTLDAARVLSEGSAKEIGDRVGVTTSKEATTFRSVLRAALKALG